MESEVVHNPVQEHDGPGQVPGVLQDAQDDVEDHDVRDYEGQDRLDAAVDSRQHGGPELALAAEVDDGSPYERLVHGGDHPVQERADVDDRREDHQAHRNEDGHACDRCDHDVGDAVLQGGLHVRLRHNIGDDALSLGVSRRCDVHAHLLAVVLVVDLAHEVGRVPQLGTDHVVEVLGVLQDLDRGSASGEAEVVREAVLQRDGGLLDVGRVVDPEPGRLSPALAHGVGEGVHALRRLGGHRHDRNAQDGRQRVHVDLELLPGLVDLRERDDDGKPQLQCLEAQDQAVDQVGGVRHQDDGVVVALRQVPEDDLLVVRVAGHAVRSGEVVDADGLAVPGYHSLIELHGGSWVVRRYDPHARQACEKG